MWTAFRGRLAEADILLAALIVGAMAALDRVRGGSIAWRGAFFALIGGTALVKGIGFGAALIAAATLAVLIWDRDGPTFRALKTPVGIASAALIALAWPLLVLARHPEAMGLWLVHVTDRLASRPTQFAGETWADYLASPFWQTLPWTPLALVGGRISLRRAVRERCGPDRLLWAWAVVPAVLVSLATVKNAHYLVHALPPWSIWAALGLERLRERRGTSIGRFRGRVIVATLGVGVAFAAGFAVLAPRLDRRGAEWAFYERAGRLVRPGEPLVLLQDDWDRLPYPSPFGPMPHDLPIRLYSLNRPALWRSSPDDLRAHRPSGAFAVIARERDLPELERMGRVEVVARGPTTRWDRAFVLYRVLSGA